MHIAVLIASAGLSFLFLLLLFRPLEYAFPARMGQRFFRPGWFTDLCFFLGQYLLWSGAVLAALTAFHGWLGGIVPADMCRLVGNQPWWLQVAVLILASDVLVYWGHRLQHRVGFLWRFHAVHHNAEHLDWLAAHREHPLDTIYTVGLVNLPAFIVGFPSESLAGFITFRGLWAVYIHSNVSLPTGPLRYVLGSPRLHHWHHARDRDAGNYANVSPLMDILFGTFRCPDNEPESFGLSVASPSTYLGYMFQPLLFWRHRQEEGEDTEGVIAMFDEVDETKNTKIDEDDKKSKIAGAVA